jgi:hypothetical protein
MKDRARQFVTVFASGELCQRAAAFGLIINLG